MPHLATYVALLHRGEQTLAASLRAVGVGHAAEVDVFHTCETLAQMSDAHVEQLAPIAGALRGGSGRRRHRRA